MKKLLYVAMPLSILCLTSQLNCFKVQVVQLNPNLGLTKVSIAIGERGTPERKELGKFIAWQQNMSDEFFASALPLRLTIDTSTNQVAKQFKQLVEKAVLDRANISLDDLNTPGKVILVISIGGDLTSIVMPTFAFKKIGAEEEKKKEIARIRDEIAKLDAEIATCQDIIRKNTQQRLNYQQQVHNLTEPSPEDMPQ